jgi:hypothetical protein
MNKDLKKIALSGITTGLLMAAGSLQAVEQEETQNALSLAQFEPPLENLYARGYDEGFCPSCNRRNWREDVALNEQYNIPTDGQSSYPARVVYGYTEESQPPQDHPVHPNQQFPKPTKPSYRYISATEAQDSNNYIISHPQEQGVQNGYPQYRYLTEEEAASIQGRPTQFQNNQGQFQPNQGQFQTQAPTHAPKGPIAPPPSAQKTQFPTQAPTQAPNYHVQQNMQSRQTNSYINTRIAEDSVQPPPNQAQTYSSQPQQSPPGSNPSFKPAETPAPKKSFW